MDAATGGGLTTVEIALRTNGTVISVDIDPAQSAAKRIEDANLSSKVELVKGNLAHMDFLDDNSIDTIVSHATVSSIPAETPFMLFPVFKEFFRVLKPAPIIQLCYALLPFQAGYNTHNWNHSLEGTSLQHIRF